jgi:hypothetical protein
MAARAFGIDVRFARLGVAHHDAGRLHARDVITADAEAVNKGGDVGHLRTAHIELGHAAIGQAFLHDRRE